ncbi:hypothetical protein BCR34DRAFT_663984 [Clohesyomyces aquaticus]|uniref:Uncharacterized protein n=1 Tax=Clohesyomyces aquaticus TaxID=1231657 RepID=A0A1Y1ZPB5_9PLEO|nr:hypothetical protein BCR34DRAFT_663984 [Clohesyomyces aquaticus]
MSKKGLKSISSETRSIGTLSFTTAFLNVPASRALARNSPAGSCMVLYHVSASPTVPQRALKPGGKGGAGVKVVGTVVYKGDPDASQWDGDSWAGFPDVMVYEVSKLAREGEESGMRAGGFRVVRPGAVCPSRLVVIEVNRVHFVGWSIECQGLGFVVRRGQRSCHLILGNNPRGGGEGEKGLFRVVVV